MNEPFFYFILYNSYFVKNLFTGKIKYHVPIINALEDTRTNILKETTSFFISTI